MKRYDLNLTMNTRDLGGYNTLDGKQVAYNKFIRSDALRYITEEDKLFLIRGNYTTNIDMRTEYVINKYPSLLKDDERFEYYNIPLIEGSGIPLTDENASNLYLQMVNNKNKFYRIFRIIIDAKSNVIFNCTAGKDRTGIIACLLLLLANVSRIDILDDYEISSTFIYERIGKIRELYPEFPENLGESKRIYLEEFLDKFYEQFKTIENYFYFLGFSEEDITKLNEKLLEVGEVNE